MFYKHKPIKYRKIHEINLINKLKHKFFGIFSDFYQSLKPNSSKSD